MENKITELDVYFSTLNTKSPCTQTLYKRAIKMLCDFLAIDSFEGLKSVTVLNADMFQINLQKQMKPTSVNTYLRPIKAMYNWLKRKQYLTINPFDFAEKVEESSTIQAYLSRNEMIELVAHSKNAEDKLMLLLLLTMGLRRSELINIKLSDVMDNMRIKINGKGNKQRILAIHPDATMFLSAQLKNREKRAQASGLPYLFISKNLTKYSGEAIRMRVKTAMVRAGFSAERIEEIHTHSLRHTFTANLLEVNTDIYVAQQALGHSSIDTTKRYAHLRSHVLDTAMTNQQSIL